MAGPYLLLRGEFGPAIKGASEATIGWQWSILVPTNLLMAGRDSLPRWQGFRVRTE